MTSMQTATPVPRTIALSDAFAQVEIHVCDSGELPRIYGKAIKAAGGRYSECRGYSLKRYVTLPAHEVRLIDAISARFKADCLILRHATEAMSDLAAQPAQIRTCDGWRPTLGDKVFSSFMAFDNAVAHAQAWIDSFATPEAWQRVSLLREMRADRAAADAKRQAEFRRQAVMAKNADEMLETLKALRGMGLGKEAFALTHSIITKIEAQLA